MSLVDVNLSPIEKMNQLALLFKITINELILISPKEICVLVGKKDSLPQMTAVKALLESPAGTKVPEKVKLIMTIVFSLSSINHEGGLFLWNYYFLPGEEGSSYVYTKSKNSFYRIRNQAIAEFLEVLGA
ncbi:MAG: hypothetical protein WCR56_02455 [Bacilli bacterium]|jgi:hypothetical protein